MLKDKTTGDALRADAVPVHLSDKVVAAYAGASRRVRRRLSTSVDARVSSWTSMSGGAGRVLPQVRPPEPDPVDVMSEPIEFDFMFASSLGPTGQHLE
jgi:hypothetical protein